MGKQFNTNLSPRNNILDFEGRTSNVFNNIINNNNNINIIYDINYFLKSTRISSCLPNDIKLDIFTHASTCKAVQYF